MINFDALFPRLIGNPLQPFTARYKCYSVAMYQQSHVSDEKVAEMGNGGKILLPHSALDHLTRLHINYPMMFKITNINPANQRITHAGVMEFHQEEGKCYMPYWMMRNLLLNEGDLIQVDYVNLPVGSFVKLQPQSPDFLDITNPRAVLELQLRNFSCLTMSDIIAIPYNNKIFEFLVEELKPANAVSIVECDMNVEFSTAVGYTEPEVKPKEEVLPTVNDQQAVVTDQNKFVPFGGKGYRSDGKDKPTANSSATALNNGQRKLQADAPVVRGIPNYDYKPGTLNFIRQIVSTSAPAVTADSNDDFQPFSGCGQSLKPKKSANR